MADIIEINIRFNPHEEKLLVIPEEIRVPQFSVVQWNIKGLEKLDLESKFWRSGLIFTLYFEKQTPFAWKRQFVQIHEYTRPFSYYPITILRLAEDEADKKGNYKYGVKVTESQENEVLYDEDPILVVY